MATTSFAQTSARITIQNKNISVIKALKKEVEKQSDYPVGYNDSQLKNKPVLCLNFKDIPLESALAQILKRTEIYKNMYNIEDPDHAIGFCTYWKFNESEGDIAKGYLCI